MATGDPAMLHESSRDVKQRDKPLVKGMETSEKAMITSNAVKMLHPRWLKPNSIETERIITVLDETIARLELSSMIPHVIDSLDRFADVLGPEITNNLIEHQKLSNEVEHLLSSSEEEDTMRAEEQRSCLCLLDQRLKCSVRDVLRLLLANPSFCQALKYEDLVRESPAEGFIKAFKEFRNFMLERLVTSPTEEEEKIRFLEEISLQIHKNTEAITALQAELAAAVRTREEEFLKRKFQKLFLNQILNLKIHKKDNVIEDLQSSIQDLTTDCKATIQNIKEEGENQQEEQMEASQERCARLQQDVQQLEAQLNALVLDHRASELALQKLF